MIILCGCLVIVVATAIAIVRSKKPINLIMAEAKYEMIYNAMGSRALMQDWLMRSQNKTELLPQPGKIAVITGGARGIGAEVVKMLMKCDITVVIGCRNVQAAEMMLKKYRDEGIDKGDIDAFQLDISYLDSVKKFAAEVTKKYPKINYLVNNAIPFGSYRVQGRMANSYFDHGFFINEFNGIVWDHFQKFESYRHLAGIMFGPRIETRDGYESQFATNYLGHFLLTHLLFNSLKRAGAEKWNSRIVNLSSCAHLAGDINFEDINYRSRYITSEAYAQSKLAQILFTNYLNNLCKKEGYHVQLHSVHPGIVNTELFDGTHLKNVAPWLPNLMFKTPEQGAAPIVHACLSPSLEGNGGTYIHNCKVFPTSELATNEELQQKLFDFTNKLLGIEIFGEAT